MKRYRAVLPILVLALAIAGCASMRSVQVGSDRNATYAVEVTNARSSTVIVSYSTGGGAVQLGSISAGQTERFIIPVQNATQITILARSTGGASLGSYPVTLEAGVTKRVTVR